MSKSERVAVVSLNDLESETTSCNPRSNSCRSSYPNGIHSSVYSRNARHPASSKTCVNLSTPNAIKLVLDDGLPRSVNAVVTALFS